MDQIAKANVDGGVCAGPVAVTVSAITCGAYRIWRKATFYWYEECVYAGAGSLVGSVNCGDTGCNYAGDVIDDAPCLDAGLGPNLCPMDAGSSADAGGDAAPACPGSAGFSCVASCSTDFGPPAFPVCSSGAWICPSGSVKLSTCPCGSTLPPGPDSGCTYP